MSYTKGKWESVETAVRNRRDGVFYHTDVLCNDTIRVARSSGAGKELALSNARLIAAAPELLEACRAVVKGFECECIKDQAPVPCEICQCQAAIEKAKKQ